MIRFKIIGVTRFQHWIVSPASLIVINLHMYKICFMKVWLQVSHTMSIIHGNEVNIWSRHRPVIDQSDMFTLQSFLHLFNANNYLFYLFYLDYWLLISYVKETSLRNWKFNQWTLIKKLKVRWTLPDMFFMQSFNTNYSGCICESFQETSKTMQN